MIEIGIMETASKRVSNTKVLEGNDNLNRADRSRLRHSVSEFNKNLRQKGEKAARIREALADDPTIDNTALREWETAKWHGEAPDKDKHYVMVEREIGPWAEVDSAN